MRWYQAYYSAEWARRSVQLAWKWQWYSDSHCRLISCA